MILAQRARLFGIAIVMLMLGGCQPDPYADGSSAQTRQDEGFSQQAAPELPELRLSALDNSPVSLSAYKGRPVVLNLWATWCPPCRREMPVFEQAKKDFSDVSFVLLNQGENARKVQAFLESENLSVTDVLLDSSSEAMRALKTGGLPTTFFFDGGGRLVDLHLGEITMADLKDKMSRLSE